MTARRPNPLALMREARQNGEGIRIIYTHAGDMVIEPCPLTDEPARACVPAHDQAAQSNIVEAFNRRIHHAQKRAS